MERSVGRAAAMALEVAYGLDRSPAAALIARLAAPLSRLQDRPLRARPKLLCSDEVNALSLPGGHVFVMRGLIGHADSLDEIAAVLAHEIGHIEDHDFRRVALRQLMWVGVEAALAKRSSSAAAAARVAGTLSALRHSRRQEAQADAYAVRACLLAGYDPAALKSFLAKLRPTAGWASRILQTHPDPRWRSRQAEILAQAALANHPHLAEALCRSLMARARPARALEIALELSDNPAHAAWAKRLLPQLRCAAAPYASVDLPALEPLRGSGLASALRALGRDATARRLLLLANALAAQPDAGYWTVAADCLLAAQMLDELETRGWELLWRAGAAAWPSARLEPMAARARQAHRAAQLICAVLGELLAFGPSRPLGELSGARIALVKSQTAWALSQIGAATDLCRKLLRDATAAATVRICRRLLERAGLKPVLSTLRAVARCDDPQMWLRQAVKIAGSGAGRGKIEPHYLLARLAWQQLSAEAAAARRLKPRRPEGDRLCSMQ